MDKRRLGRTGATIPVVGMGTWKTFDVRGTAEEHIRSDLVAEALKAGTRLFDSSPMYGEAERVLGQALGSRRREAFVATKVWAKSLPEAHRQIQASLQYFQGHIDLYQVHNLSLVQEVLPLLLDLKSTGQVRYVGATHWNSQHFAELAKVMESGRIDTVQIPYNARDQGVAKSLLPLAEELDLGVLVMVPLGTGTLTRNPPPRDEYATLEGKGIHTWAQALLKWVLSDPRVDVVLPATSRPGRPTENALAGEPPWLSEPERDTVARLAHAIPAE